MRKFELVFKELAKLRSVLRGKNTIKLAKNYIGDSVKNNRTLTVNQTVRLLILNNNLVLAAVIEVIYPILKGEILKRRASRSDAIDLSELINTYRTVVMDGRSDTYRRRIGNALSKVG